MPSIAVIMAQIFKTDIVETWKFACSNPAPLSPVPASYEVVGEEWFAPSIFGGVVNSYEPIDSIDTPADAVRTVRLRDRVSGSSMWILGTADDWADAANACCGAVPEMPAVTIVDPINLEEACGISDCTLTTPVYTFTTSFQDDIVVGQKLTLVGKNGTVAFTPAPPGGGFATVAAALAWAQANWGAYGTWTAVGTKGIKLESNGVTKGYLEMKLQNVTYCMTIVAGNTFNQVTNGTDTFALGKTVTVVDATQVINEIKQYFADGTLSAFSSTKIQYVGLSVPVGLKLNGAAVTSFVAGACS